MMRKSRLEFFGAIYHVINRGNCRKPIFEEGGGVWKTLFEACSTFTATNAWIAERLKWGIPCVCAICLMKKFKI